MEFYRNEKKVKQHVNGACMSVFALGDDVVDHECIVYLVAAETASDGGNNSSSSVNARCSLLPDGSSTDEPLSQAGLALDEGK